MVQYTGPRWRAVLLALSLPITIAAAADARAGQSPPSDWRSQELEQWLAAVEGHAPGRVDSSLTGTASLSVADLRKLWVDIQALLAIAANPRVTRFPVRPVPGDSWLRTQYAREITFSRTERAVLDGLAARVRTIGTDVVRRRAAVVHTDVLTLTPGLGPDEPEGAWAGAFLRMHIGDGTSLGVEHGSLHWELARMVLDVARPNPQLDPFMRAWYRATIALGQSTESFDAVHMKRALALFPDDADVLLLAGCEREALATPLFQAFARSLRSTSMQSDIRSARTELGAAEAFFRRALAANPDLVEARVRLGRVLALQGRLADSLRELNRAAEAPIEPVLAYYVALFLGLAHEGLGSPSAARDAYRRAAEEAPGARAPHLALARIALESGDRDEMTARLSRAVRPITAGDPPDPWWQYRSMQGRHGKMWLDEVRRAASGPRR